MVKIADITLGQVIHTDLNEPLDVTNKALHVHTSTGENVDLASVLTKLTELDNKIDAISNADNMKVSQVGSFVSEIFADNVEIINATYHFFPGNSTGFSGHTQTKVLTPKKTITIINNFDVSFTYYLVVSNIKSESAKNQIAALTLASGANISISGKDYAELDKPWKYLSVGLNCTSVPSSGSVNIVVGGNY